MMKATAKKTAAARLPALDYRISFSGRELVLMSSSQKRVYTLPLEKLRPSIRIAHRLTGELQIDRRIILDHEIVLILSGKGILKMEPDDVTFATGDLLFIPPFTPHAFVSPTGAVSEHAAVHFDLAAEFPRFAANVLRRPPYEVRLAQGLVLPRHFKTRPADSIRAWLLELIPLFAQGDPLGRLRAEALLLHILTMLLDAPRATPAPEADGPINAALRFRIEKAIDHLENHFAEPMTPADLARAAGLSVSHFGRVFRRWGGAVAGGIRFAPPRAGGAQTSGGCQPFGQGRWRPGVDSRTPIISAESFAASTALRPRIFARRGWRARGRPEA